MSITDELRRYIHREMWDLPKWKDELRPIADRIDAEYQKAIRELNNLADTSMLLPVDADGEYIHIGDMMWQKDRITKRACKAIMGDAYVMLDGIQCAVYAKGLTHYHAPTVEDVLREFAERVCNSGHRWGLDAADTIAEYAAKLRLAGDAE